ncbi:hypothetical protein TrRE_jg7019 [Triparma retinervis]|uniref:Ceramidase n=1 Tax=Triparma retinervis TaxID=2557542 RepID=A0A9W7G5R9_9STRA|nr:hypothetical protein TrRE_jg7019 [Triparma retinervis]
MSSEKSYLRSHAYHHLLLISFVTLIIIVVPLALNVSSLDGREVWGDVTEDLICAPDQNGCSALNLNEHYCERIVWSRFLRTPYNAMSNMAFVISSMITLSTVSLHYRWMDHQRPRVPPQNHLQRCDLLNKMYALLLAVGGLGSFVCHSAITYFSAQLDRAGIWMILTPVLAMTLLRWVPMTYGEAKGSCFYHGWIVFWYVLLPGGLSAFHLIDPTNALATPLLYIGIPIIVGGCISLAAVRFCLGKCGYIRETQSNYKLAAAAIVTAGVGFLFQVPERVGACDAGSGLVWKLTHAYWHILISLACFFNHRFCFFERLYVPDFGEKAGINASDRDSDQDSDNSLEMRKVDMEEENSAALSVKNIDVII